MFAYLGANQPVSWVRGRTHRNAVVLASRRWREDHEILICALLLAIRARNHPSS